MNELNFIEITEESYGQKLLSYGYVTKNYYDFLISKNSEGWDFKLQLKEFGKEQHLNSQSTLFKSAVENPAVFQCLNGGEEAGIFQTGYQRWNKRVRIWDILVEDKFRGQGIGSKIMSKIVEDAKKLNARMVVLETQSCNVPAINFYQKHGFELIGFDTHHYSNTDLEKREVRLEFGLKI